MGRKAYTVLHRSEWDRLHRRKDDKKQLLSNEREAYFQRLVDISQSWIKTWPDTVQGHIEKLNKEKKKHQQDDIALVKAYLKKKKAEGTTAAITKAKQKIFEGSCYGKQLTSALLESKTLEERELQIEYQKEIKQKFQDQEKEALSKLNFNQCSFDLDKRDDENKRKKKEMEIELAKINQSIYEMEISKKNKEKLEQEELDRKNAGLMQELLDREARQEKEYENLLRRDVESYEGLQKIAKERQMAREKKEEEIANAQRAELDRKYSKIRRVMKDMHKDRQNTNSFKQNYELIKELQEKEEKRYNDFVEKAVKKLEVRTLEKEKQETLKQKSERDKRVMISEQNKAEADRAELYRVISKQGRCCAVDRQCIMPKSCYNRKKSPCSAIEGNVFTKYKMQPVTFLAPAKKFLQQLEARKKQPSPWGALHATHAQFAREAGRALHEARHKRFVKKVIDDYRKTNCLDATSLPVPNYN
ncbi:hypothetical protein ABMA27_005098 [Loxostege sticticalis]|uniref:Trichohyalin-plectin-homology domain-containing protein n=1 Tax=Loxostege sticticalis TaxID=481309 RepID=A0ABR3HLT3_LOXSC